MTDVLDFSRTHRMLEQERSMVRQCHPTKVFKEQENKVPRAEIIPRVAWRIGGWTRPEAQSPDSLASAPTTIHTLYVYAVLPFRQPLLFWIVLWPSHSSQSWPWMEWVHVRAYVCACVEQGSCAGIRARRGLGGVHVLILALGVLPGKMPFRSWHSLNWHILPYNPDLRQRCSTHLESSTVLA